jgi:hypothetical protein
LRSHVPDADLYAELSEALEHWIPLDRHKHAR